VDEATMVSLPAINEDKNSDNLLVSCVNFLASKRIKPSNVPNQVTAFKSGNIDSIVNSLITLKGFFTILY
jgi:hypothetical protein